MKEKIAVYPGTFDPITNGHLSIVNRALKIFDKLIIAILNNPKKVPLFTLEERIEMIREAIKEDDRVVIDAYGGLLVDYVVKMKSNVILRGLRALSDFEYEFQMALMNRRLDRKVETIFMMTGYKWFYVSSRIIRDVIVAGGSVEGLVPEFVNQKLRERFGKK